MSTEATEAHNISNDAPDDALSTSVKPAGRFDRARDSNQNHSEKMNGKVDRIRI